VTGAALVALLEGHRFDESSEDALQRGVAQVLAAAGCSFTREVPLTRQDRIDFLVGGVGVECKTDGSLSALTRQLHRYALATQVEALVLVTTRARLARVPPHLNGKRISVVATMGGLV
jgi:NAD(P)-dependent dehydrogenase (short-subunit alcohol dehydrogenase family)